MAGSCDHSKEPSGAKKEGNFDELSDYWLLKNGSMALAVNKDK